MKFECKAHKHQAFDKWAGHILAQLGMMDLFNELGLMKVIIQARAMVVERKPTNLEFLMSRRNTETHTFVAS